MTLTYFAVLWKLSFPVIWFFNRWDFYKLSGTIQGLDEGTGSMEAQDTWKHRAGGQSMAKWYQLSLDRRYFMKKGSKQPSESSITGSLTRHWKYSLHLATKSPLTKCSSRTWLEDRWCSTWPQRKCLLLAAPKEVGVHWHFWGPEASDLMSSETIYQHGSGPGGYTPS